MPRPTRPRLLRLAALLPLALAPLTASCGGSRNEVRIDEEAQLQIYRETALAHYENDDLLRAEEQALKGLGIAGEDFQLRLLFAWIKLQKNTVEDLLVAEKVFLAIQDDNEEGDDFRVELGLAQTRERLGVIHDRAATEIEAGTRTTTAPDPYARVAELRAQAEDFWRGARTGYERVVARKPGNVKALNGLQRVTALQLDYDASLDWSRNLILVTQQQQAAYEAQLTLGDLELRQEARIRGQIQTMIELQINTHLHAADIFTTQGRPEEALDQLDRALAFTPDLPDAWARRALILKDMGRYEEARRSAEHFLRRSAEPYDHPDVRRAYDLMTECERLEREARESFGG
jgi:tetratricopeptide (TPR) repeat protein